MINANNQNDFKQIVLDKMIDTAVVINRLGDAVVIATRNNDFAAVKALRETIEAHRMNYEDYAENLETINREMAKADAILNKVING